MKNNNKHESDEVEQLLQAAQDEILLKLSVDSHLSSSNSLNSDLDRRFHALKSRPSVPQSTSSLSQSQSQSDRDVNVDDELKNALGDHLSARFAALKASSSTKTGHMIHDDDDGEDEVDKIIRWAKDAARLDPSPPSDDGHDTDKNSDHETDSDSDSDSDSDEEPQRRRKQN